RSGLATVTVEFREGVNVDVAANDVQQKVSGVRRDLPAEVEEPAYAKLDLNDVPVAYLAVTADGPAATEADAARLYRVAGEAVPGVGRVLGVGGREPEVEVELLPDRLRAYGLAIADVTNAVRAQFLGTSGGDVKTGGGESTRQASLRVDSRDADVSTLGAFP